MEGEPSSMKKTFRGLGNLHVFSTVGLVVGKNVPPEVGFNVVGEFVDVGFNVGEEVGELHKDAI